MNFPGPINSNLSSASAISLEGERFNFTSVSSAGSGHGTSGSVVIPDKNLLFHGDYARQGNDLILSTQDQKYVVHDYFKGEKRAALTSEDGAVLSGHVISSLTGYTQYAQAAPSDTVQVIGHVMKLSGSASVIRNGVTVELNIGDALQKGDVIQTGSDTTIAMTLIDGTAFGMTANARMVLNEMVFDPNGSSNSSFISLVQGTITFVAGQTAKNGNMRVETPVATMGIRGTAVLVKIISETGNVETSLGVEPDGHVGGLVFYDNATGALIGTMTQAGRVTVFTPSGLGQPVTATEYLKSPDQTFSDKGLFNQVFQLYFPNYNPDANPKSTDRPRTDIGVPPTVLGKIGTDPDTGRPTITYTIQITNPDTHTTTDLKIIYTNTPPSFSVTNVTDVQATVLGPHSFKLGDHVTITDPDIGTAPFFDVAIPYVANSGFLKQVATTSPATNSILLSSNLVTINAATGVVTYNPEGFRFLGEGEKAVYTFQFVSASGVGSSGSDQGVETLTLTVTGENDSPVFTLNDTPVSFSETQHQFNDATPHVFSGIQLAFTDEDFSDVASVFNLSSSVTTKVVDNASNALLSHLPDNATLQSFLTFDHSVDSSLGVSRVPLTNQGTVTARFSAPDNAFDFLGEGEKIQIVYTIQIDDGHAGSTPSTETITFTVTGTNDAPILAMDTGSHGIRETIDATDIGGVSSLALNGSLAYSDVDLTDLHTTTSPTSYGSAIWEKPDHTSGGTVPTATLNALKTALTTSLDATGTGGNLLWNFKLADSFADFLAKDETLTIQYSVNVNDGHTDIGNTTQTITIVITGTNDAPVAVADNVQGIIVEAGNNPDDTVFAGTPQTTGNVLTNDTDVDINDTHTVVGVAAGNTTPTLNVGVGATIHGTYGDLVLNTDGTWTYTLDNARPATNALAQGVHVNDVFSYTEADNNGSTSSTTLTIGITGTNDAPITNNAPVAATDLNTGLPITEKGVSPGDTVFNGNDTATGNVLANDTDVDTGDTQTVQGVAAGTSTTPLTGHVGTVVTGTYGSVTIAANGDWTYTLNNNNPATDALKQGEVAHDVFTYTMHDAQGATSSATLTIDITGTNDAPVITNAPADEAGSVREDTTLTTTGQLSASDVDHDATQTWSIVDSANNTTAASLNGTYGSLSVDPTTGQWTYNLANGSDGVAGPVQSLAAGEHHDETFTVRVTDDQGAYVDQTVTVTVNGTDDAPVAVADTIANDAPPSSAGWVLNPDNGHYYRYVAGDAYATWTDAQTAASSDGGYLATVTSSQESSFVYNLIANHTYGGTWLGGYGPTANDPSSWYWTGGPEQGAHLTFTNWNAGEPNGFPGYTDAGLNINPDGTWNDVPTSQNDYFGGFGYVEEWGGQAGQIAFREDTGTTLTTQQLLANDTDIDTAHASLSITGVSASSANGGSVSLDGNIITYHPAANYNGPDSFTYTLSDGSLTSTGTVSFNVTPVNDAPVLDLNSADTPDVSTSYAANLLNDGNPFPIAVAPAVTDVDNTTMASATVVLEDGQSGDFFFVPGESSPGSGSGVLASGITWIISGTAGDSLNPLTITFSGAYSNADYADAIQQISFGTTATAGDRHIDVTVNDGTDSSNTAVATITVQDSGNVAPVANNDAISISAVSNLFATSGNLTGNDSDPGDTFAIYSASHGGPPNEGPDTEGIIRIAGTFGTLLLFTTDHAASTTLGSLSVPGAFAGDYVFVIGYDINGNPIADNPIAKLLPGDAPLTDQFQYTVIDSHGVGSNTANINVTYDLNPIVETVRTDAGYNVTTLWTDISSNNTITSVDANHITLTNGNHTIVVDTTNLTWNNIPDGIELTGGVINAFHVTDTTTSAALLDLTNLNTLATDLYATVGPSGSQAAFDGLFDTRAFDVHGGAGADVLNGYNFNDRIDTGGGADIVNAGDGNDVIVVHDNAAWQIDGGAGVDTLKLDGHFDLANGPQNQSVSNVEILDMKNGVANVVAVSGEGISGANSEHTIRVLGDSNDRVALGNIFQGHESGHWGLENVSTTYTGDHVTDGVTFTEYAFRDQGVTYATAFVEQGVEVNVRLLSGDGVTSDGTSTLTVYGISLNDTDQSAHYLVSAVAEHGSVASVSGYALDDPMHYPVVASVADINADFAQGVVYTPNGDAPDANGQLYDTVTLTVRDTTNLVQDSMNFIFRQQGTGPATLVGTNEKDIIGGTPYDDTMSGMGGKDNFVFTDTLIGTGNDTITDFQSGNDHIVLNNFGNLFNGDAIAWFNSNVTDSVSGAVVSILDANNVASSITLTGVTKANLSANDFILHPGTLPHA